MCILLVKLFRYIFIVLAIVALVTGGITVKKIIHERIVAQVPADSVRVHLLTYGQTRDEAVGKAAQMIAEAPIPVEDYTIIEAKIFSYKFTGDIVWICDISLNIKQSVLQQDQVLPQKLSLSK